VRQRILVAALTVLLVGCGSPTTPSATSTGVPTSTDPSATAALVAPTPSWPVPEPGHEVFGFVPYWEMGGSIAEHVANTSLTTLALFSVTHRKNGTINTSQNGYKRITGPIGQQLIREAHDRGVRVELVYTSFGYERNAALFGGPIAAQDKVIASLVAFADEQGFDGINVDVELLDEAYADAYGAFVGRLRTAVLAKDKHDQVSVATTSGPGGAAMALAAAANGADRIFLMGYDYHWSGSDPGATSPIDRLDGNEKDLVWSLDLYRSMGVPVEKTILGLPLYGMAWPVESGAPDAPATGKGDTWVPRSHLDVLTDPSVVPVREPVEVVEVYTLESKAKDGTPAWQRLYLDSPDTLTPKLALADDRGLAGAGFWAIGYTRGLPDYTALIGRFAAGKLH